MNTSPSSHSPAHTRALVLGGGGSAGNAWLIGVIAGLFDGGLDATHADLVVGTSAGSTAAAQLTSAAPSELLAGILSAVLPPRTAPSIPGGGSVADHMNRTARIIAASADAADMRRRMGDAALELAAGAGRDRQTSWRATVASRLPSQSWPRQAIAITAVDAATGESVIFDRHSGVALADAVAASCSSGFAYTIGDRHYIDGGYRSNADNADLAAGYEGVLVLSPFGGETRTPDEWGLDLAAQIRALQAGGSTVETIFPDADSRAAFGENAMDPSSRLPAAQAGYEQGRILAGPLMPFWRGML